MRVRLAQPMSGSRNGVPWPGVGTVVDLPDDEAREMINSGQANAVNDKDKPGPDLKVPDKVEDAVDAFVPETARHQPSIGVENLPDDDRRPVMKHVGLTDDHEIAHGPASLPKVGDDVVDMTTDDPGTGTRSTPSRASSAPVSAPKDTSKGGGAK